MTDSDRLRQIVELQDLAASRRRELDAANRKLDRVRALTETTDSPGWVRAGDLLDALEV